MGMAHFHLNALGSSRFTHAVRWFQQAHKLDPNNTQFVLSLATAYFHSQNYGNASAYLTLALKSKSLIAERSQYYNMLAIAYHNGNNENEGDNALSHLSYIDPQTGKYIANHGSLNFRDVYLLQQVQKNYELAISADPRRAVHYYNLGILHAQQGQHHLAIDAYRRAIQRDPKFDECRGALGLSMMALHDYSGAAIQFRRAVLLNPMAVSYIFHFGRCLFLLKLYEEAAEVFKKACELEPENTNFLNWLATTYYELRMYSESDAVFQKSNAVDVHSHTHHYIINGMYFTVSSDPVLRENFTSHLM
jgi:tetratricopeptide (TPR) repeat protein